MAFQASDLLQGIGAKTGQREEAELLSLTLAQRKRRRQNASLPAYFSPQGEGFLPDSKPEESPHEATLEEMGPTQVVAQYNYKATQPEDLEFQAGDMILVLSKGNCSATR